eukprot:jgi/Ulvmu1/8582/UM045_0025.1
MLFCGNGGSTVAVMIRQKSETCAASCLPPAVATALAQQGSMLRVATLVPLGATCDHIVESTCGPMLLVGINVEALPGTTGVSLESCTMSVTCSIHVRITDALAV